MQDPIETAKLDGKRSCFKTADWPERRYYHHITQAIVNVGLKNVISGANPMDIKRGIDS
ncbi:MAG: hypothetical protein R2771_14815 [Saprospiraceae bacterium]